MAVRARVRHEEWLNGGLNRPIDEIQFDDLETFEHTKCKPLSVTLVVNKKTREILGFNVSRMSAKGPLARIALKKYGPRKDERPIAWDSILIKLKPYLSPTALIESDENPHYPKFVKRHFGDAIHVRHPGARGAVTGQGELKKLVFDPLFSLNHTCAMLRANLNRLFRRTWCTTKNQQGLIDHLSLYVTYHNEVLIGP
jgi:hypothetical protein